MKLASIYNELEYKENKPAITVLLETDFTKEIRIVFKKGQLMKEHKTPFPIVIEIFEGNIDFGVSGKVQSLKKGDLIALEAGMPHNLEAKENSIVRLTLSKLDKVERVKQVEN
ncbi:cupin domain-containing protein [Tenacibaculum finnmarkense genomovar ulcerans]|uniref:cupin domain-containing protein n=1 Tax=Tenacibaculum finnmarkense TaxID=2781243 RepID=UPI001E5D2109|nr:cupin domain-containing protein [Tenacibaculum finnmarkense]MCD8453266.1 cupin domain-containing protein [Tenacibaculum finnmarkense genomovar ulcerans]